jgi:FixJ family two-component response regulator
LTWRKVPFAQSCHLEKCPFRAPAAAEKPQESQKLQHNPLAVLVVDDDPAVCSSLKFALELEGFHVSHYPDASAVLGADNLSAPDCLVIDLRLPGMDGLALLAELRRRKITAPAILITSHPSAFTRARAERAGITIIEKPLLGNALTEGIRKAMQPAPRE